ncbi:MAG: phosphatidate cytidylyltransferase [Phycisphaerae bacterium]|jgi:phosphatidate cytidylyltransferase
MTQRVTFGTLAIAVLVFAFAVDIRIAEWYAVRTDGALGELLARGSTIPLLVAGLTVLGAIELGRLLRRTAAQAHIGFACVMVAALILCPWLSAAGWLGDFPAAVEGLFWEVFVLIAAVIGAAILTILRRNPDGALRDFGATCIPIFYIGFLTSFAVQLRCGRDVAGQDGAWLLLFVVLTTKGSDIGAYFVGSAIGRRKIAPTLSPGKSLEGAIGGLVAGGLSGAALAEVARERSLISTLTDGTMPEGWWTLAGAFLVGLVLSAAGQLGDLLESGFKRDAGTKDSGDVIPHLGGILDLIDSPVLALPVAWLVLTVLFNVV